MDERQLVTIVWSWEDVKTLKSEWSKYKCLTWLKENEKIIRDRSVEEGWGIIESLLTMGD